MLSNVTGDNLPNLRSFLNILPSSQNNEKYVTDAPFELHISDAFSVPFIGTVVSGVVESGVVKPNDQVLVGPDSLGHFIPTAIRSIEKKRVLRSTRPRRGSVLREFLTSYFHRHN